MITQGEAIDIPVTVSDENGDALNLTGAGLTGYSLPNFVTFTDNGNGTGVFHLAPGGNTVVGDYTIYLTATEQRSYAVGEEHSTIGNFLVTVNAGVGNIPDVVTPPVVRAVNHRPNLTPLPLQLGYENRSITFELKGNDGDGDALVYTIDQVTKDEIIVAIPKGAFINPNTGKFVWNTDYNQAGHYNFKFSTLDPSGLQDTKDVVVWIENVNRSPLFEPSNRAVALGKELKFLLGGSDPDLNGVLTYKAIDLPTGASLDSNTGEFKWTPDASQVGVHNVSFTVSDGEETVKRIVTIKVRNQIVAPKLSIDLTLGFPVLPGQRVIVNALADSEADIAGFKVVVDGQEINTFQPNATRNGGSFTFISNQTGRHNLSITVTDLDGRVSQLDRVIKVRDGADILAPIVQFEPGLDGSQITTVTKLLGKVSDSNLDEWRLEIATLGTESYRQLNGGSGSVNGLGDLDPGTLTNGFYQLRLTAVDISGRQSVTTSVVEINSSSKSGYQSQATDLVTSLAGVEVKLQRFYSPAQGWRFGLDSDIQLSNGSTSQALAVGTRLYLTTPAGERVGFTFTPEQRQIAGLTYYVPKWTADQGVNYQLESAAAQLSLAGSRFYDVGTGVPYNPSSAGLEQYTLGAAGGVKYLLNSQYGVVGQVGANGARLIYSDSGIVANNGDAVEFVNDAAGRLSQVRSNNGANLTYSYDLQGNLGSVRGFGQQQFYGYEAGVLRSIVGAVGQPGVLIENGVTRAISQNLGGVSSFNGKTINAVAGESYGFSIALGASGAIGARELKTAKEQRVLISVAGDAAIKGLVPVEVHDGFRVYGIDRAATYVVEAAGAFTLAVVGDVNLDGRVDGLDSQLVTTAGIYDVNGDKAFSEKDLQLLAGNFGFVGNQAPVITPVTSLTHVDLTTRIALDSLVTDPDGDLVTFGVQDGANGHVELSVDGRYVLFTPNVGFSGTGNFELLASDGLGLSQKQITVNVSDAALVNLDIVNRNPKLQVGDKYQLQVIGDFADQKGVALLRDYVQYGVNTAAVSIDNLGLIRAISDGVGIISASRNGISAVTATRVGIFNPVTDVDVVIAKAENYGLDVYPGAVTLIPGMERQILVTTLDGSESSNALTASATGTKYFVSNPNIVDVSAEGLITVKQTGVANVTVINQGAEFRMALQVELPRGNYSSLNVSGGAIKASDGAVVTIAPGALSKDTVVSIQQIAASEVSQLLPPDYDFVGAFKLNVGDDELITSAQIAINAPKDLAVGTEVFFLQKGEIPNEQGELVPIWFMEESGRVGADGMIRTSSPPWNGVKKTGEFVVAVPTFTYSAIEVSVFISKVAALHAGALFLGALSGIASVYFNSYSVVSGGLLKNLYGKAVGKIDDVFYGSIDILTRIPLILGKFANALNNPPVSVLTVPTYGLPYTTTANVEINPGQLPTVKAEINAQAAGDYQPVVNSVELQTVDVNGGVQPVLFLGGQNFGNSLSQLQVDLISATGEVINLQVIDSLSTSTKIAVKPTNLLPINSHGHLQVTPKLSNGLPAYRN